MNNDNNANNIFEEINQIRRYARHVFAPSMVALTIAAAISAVNFANSVWPNAGPEVQAPWSLGLAMLGIIFILSTGFGLVRGYRWGYRGLIFAAAFLIILNVELIFATKYTAAAWIGLLLAVCCGFGFRSKAVRFLADKFQQRRSHASRSNPYDAEA